MTQKTISLASLLPPKGNPRRHFDQAHIAHLAASIQTDGVLQNLTVRPVNGGKFRVVIGKRRYLALQLLKTKGAIGKDYKVPVEIRRNLPEEDAKRIAAVENVQREPLDPIDEAEAFASLLRNGATVEDVAAKAGLSDQTIRRRLVLASLCKEVKESVRSGTLPLGIAEALTLATAEKQREILKSFEGGMELDREEVRHMLLAEKPTAAMAIFPLERYSGTFTKDLFADAETTYVDDTEQFLALQKEAVAELAEKHRQTAAFVDVLDVWSPPWWQYQEAKKGKNGEDAGVVINLSPSGQVEVREGLIRHQVDAQVAEETRTSPPARKPRSGYGANLLRYVANHKSMAIQGALLAHPRKAKEVAAVLLLLGSVSGSDLVRLKPHSCRAYLGAQERKPKAHMVVEAETLWIAEKLGLSKKGKKAKSDPWEAPSACEPSALYAAVKRLKEKDIDRMITALLVSCFGQEGVEELDTERSFFNLLAEDLKVSMREWWVPDADFLSGFRREELARMAVQCGASVRLGRLQDYGKHKLVEALAKYFERTADPKAELDKYDRKGRSWLPAMMQFPAKVEAADPAE